MVHVQTGRINSQIQTNKTELNQVNKTNKKLKAQVADLKDPDYVAKVIRYKFYYSKSGESIYTLPDKEEDY
ncbi:septum formation initiator family protein, partial [Escherichia coli]|jgi:cell division protein DivIC